MKNNKLDIKSAVHIFFIPLTGNLSEAGETIREIIEHKDDIGKFHLIVDEATIRPFIASLPKSTLLYFWIHIDKHGLKKRNGYEGNLKYERSLKRIIRKSATILFFTARGTAYGMGEPISETTDEIVKIKRGKKEYLLCSMEGLTEHLTLLPPPSKPSDFFPKTKQQDKCDRDFLSNILKKELLRNETIDAAVVQEVLEAYGKLGNNYKVIARLNPFLSGDNKGVRYAGLVINSVERTRILNNLKVIKSTYGKIKHTLIKIMFEVNWIPFIAWIENMETAEKYRGESLYLTLNKCYTPLGSTHGDFCAANVVLNDDYSEATIINSTEMSDGLMRHGFLDLGKLSADLEISVMPEILMLDNMSRLNRWCNYHSDWIGSPIQSSQDDSNTLFEKKPTTEADSLFADFYNIQAAIYQYVKKQYADSPMKNNHIERQFQMARLHYFLKALAHNNMSREKTIFLIWASMDILEYLIKNTKTHN